MFKHTVTMDTYGERIKPNPSSVMVERRITADQILHLCKLLAEQSRTKSSFDRRRIAEDECGSSTMEIQSEDITSSRSPELELCDRVNNSECHIQERILADSNVDTLNVVPTTTVTTTTTPTTTTKHVKKDILNKIRNQIFERKRQKLAIVQKRTVSGVWRPW